MVSTVCQNAQGSWFCSPLFPNCGTTNGQCETATCSCGGCNPDPCQYMTSESDCLGCCAGYIPGLAALFHFAFIQFKALPVLADCCI
jgi:hypothetical protein